ncbi:hypothetical protein [Entomobacter blattae]|uniref:Uncharacterized protein n=1 Tax=Entomobacter blattae TaxID=2762277 RepID=A0A7H1NUV0_9PROT|nr:hypothetical protein [Entomobacter blattae]QNT79560.1 hypothetical protein JGUZn3_23600 [Entomobacter blattae]
MRRILIVIGGLVVVFIVAVFVFLGTTRVEVIPGVLHKDIPLSQFVKNKQDNTAAQLIQQSTQNVSAMPNQQVPASLPAHPSVSAPVQQMPPAAQPPVVEKNGQAPQGGEQTLGVGQKH